MIRISETFRERVPEWANAGSMTGWGMLVLSSPSVFKTQPFFTPLLDIAPQGFWGVAATIIGFTRIIFLVINGAWRPSAHIRALGSIFGIILWATVFFAILNVGWIAPTVSVYATLLFLDFVSLWYSAGDAKLADLEAKNATEIL